MEKTNRLLEQANLELGAVAAKGGTGLIVAGTALTVNDIAALIVAILTGIYMAFQIEASWRKRRVAIAQEKAYLKEKEDSRGNP